MLAKLQGKGSPHLCQPPKLVPGSKQALAVGRAVPQPRAEQVGGLEKDSPVGCHLPPTAAVVRRAEAASPS